MSGGHFDYVCHRIDEMTEQLAEEIENNGKGLSDEFGDRVSTDFEPATIALLIRAHGVLYRAVQIAKDVEWLYSGDHGEESFRELIKQELAELDKQL